MSNDRIGHLLRGVFWSSVRSNTNINDPDSGGGCVVTAF